MINVIFLDFDGILNCDIFYEEKYKHLTRYDNIPFYKTVKKHLRRLLRRGELDKFEYYKSETCPIRMELLNNLCKETNSAVVLSASMRSQWSVDELQEIFDYCGATFTIIDKTPYTGYERGTEISLWLKTNVEKWFGVSYREFHEYAILDDDTDFLICQQKNFFHVDNYYGLTPDICNQIKNFLIYKTL